MSDPIIVPAEITEPAPKENIVKKVLRQPKKLLVGAGIALAFVGGAVWFAVSRMDEEDFEDTYPSEPAEIDATEDTTV